MMRRNRLALLLSLTLIAGCSSMRHQDANKEPEPQAQQQPQLTPEQQRMEALTAQLSKSQARIEELEAKMAAMNDSLEGTRLAVENIAGPKEAKTVPVGENNDRLDPTAADAESEEKRQAASRPTKKTAKPHANDSEKVALDPDAAAAGNSEAVGLFVQATNLARKGNHADAVLAYTRFVESYPDHALAGSAQFQAGESYFHMGQYKLALVEYQKVVSGFSGSPRVPSALVRMAHCHGALGNEKESGRYMGLAQENYPGNPSLDWPAPRPPQAAPQKVATEGLKAAPMEMSEDHAH